MVRRGRIWNIYWDVFNQVEYVILLQCQFISLFLRKKVEKGEQKIILNHDYTHAQ